MKNDPCVLMVNRNKPSLLPEQLLSPWLQLYIGIYYSFMRINCNHTARSVFNFSVLLCIWKCSSCSGCGGVVWSCLGCKGLNCVVVLESSQWFNTDLTGHITTGWPASLDTRKHENHWNNYKHYDTSFCCGRTEPVSLSNCLWLRFKLGSSFSLHACVHARVWNVSIYQIKDMF